MCSRVWVIVALLFAVGCGGNDDGRLEVSGTVKFKGEPIKDGASVRLVAVEPKDNGEATTLTAGGSFTVAKANGLKPGKYLVQLSLGDGKTAVNPVDASAPPGPGGGTNIISKELIPPKWGSQSKETVTVTKEGPNKFDFVID